MASQHFTLRVVHATRPDDPALITLDGRHTLYDLHLAIQTAFGWDDDHEYSFFMSGRALPCAEAPKAICSAAASARAGFATSFTGTS